MRLRRALGRGHSEDVAIRIALRSLARSALALEDMLAEGLLWGDERRMAYMRVVDAARVVGEMQWPESLPAPAAEAAPAAEPMPRASARRSEIGDR